jgi:demethylmenaquinone methyltransferase/2-methoxy-6-polyprenyl-1,4-benzoquinol methylase
VVRAFEWTHRHFPNLLDCRPIYACRALAAAGFVIEDTRVESMWIPVEIVRAGKPSDL